MRMVDAIGPEHVMFGTDMDGVGPYGVMGQLGDLRALRTCCRSAASTTRRLRAICFGNYARCLRTAMEGRKG